MVDQHVYFSNDLFPIVKKALDEKQLSIICQKAVSEWAGQYIDIEHIKESIKKHKETIKNSKETLKILSKKLKIMQENEDFEAEKQAKEQKLAREIAEKEEQKEAERLTNLYFKTLKDMDFSEKEAKEGAEKIVKSPNHSQAYRQLIADAKSKK